MRIPSILGKAAIIKIAKQLKIEPSEIFTTTGEQIKGGGEVVVPVDKSAERSIDETVERSIVKTVERSIDRTLEGRYRHEWDTARPTRTRSVDRFGQAPWIVETVVKVEKIEDLNEIEVERGGVPRRRSPTRLETVPEEASMLNLQPSMRVVGKLHPMYYELANSLPELYDIREPEANGWERLTGACDDGLCGMQANLRQLLRQFKDDRLNTSQVDMMKAYKSLIGFGKLSADVKERGHTTARPGWLVEGTIESYLKLCRTLMQEVEGHEVVTRTDESRYQGYVILDPSCYSQSIRTGTELSSEKCRRQLGRRGLTPDNYLSKFVIIPFNDTEDHWRLMILRPRHDRVILFDSFNMEISGREQRRWGERFIRDRIIIPLQEGQTGAGADGGDRQRKYVVELYPSRHQENSGDCGIWMLYTIRHLLEQIDPALIDLPARSDEARKHLMMELVDGRLYRNPFGR